MNFCVTDRLEMTRNPLNSNAFLNFCVTPEAGNNSKSFRNQYLYELLRDSTPEAGNIPKSFKKQYFYELLRDS